jgi:hypothetical protein
VTGLSATRRPGLRSPVTQRSGRSWRHPPPLADLHDVQGRLDDLKRRLGKQQGSGDGCGYLLYDGVADCQESAEHHR